MDDQPDFYPASSPPLMAGLGFPQFPLAIWVLPIAAAKPLVAETLVAGRGIQRKPEWGDMTPILWL
jgi:hypothetical protein